MDEAGNGTAADEVEAELAALRARQEEIDVERGKLSRRMAPLQNKMRRLGDERRALDDRIGALLASRMGEQSDWAVLLAPENVDRLHREREKALRGIGLFGSGYWVETGQPAAKIVLVRDSAASVARMVEAVRLLVPHYTPHPDGYVWFGVFEHTLSEGGSYRLLVAPDMKDVRLVCTRWGRATHKEFDGIEAAVRHVAKHHWYQETEEGSAE